MTTQKIHPFLFAGLSKFKQGLYIREQTTDISERIIYIVCQYFNIDIDLLKSVSRKREIALPRMICMYLMKEKTGLTWVKIAEKFNRDHSTAFYAIDTIKDLISSDNTVKIGISEIEKLL